MAETIKTSLQNSIFTVEIARPDVRNAFNEVLIAELQSTFEKISKDPEVRAVVLKGQGPVFCAGGDLKWMQKSVSLPAEENLVDTRKLAQMFSTLNQCPKPVIGLVHGAAIGGGVGLVSICDYVVCSQETVFSLSEVRLGIIPACIGPFVLAKIGQSHARSFFISAERFHAKRAYEIGLIHEVVEKPEDLENSLNRIVKNLLQCGPQAMCAAKSLIRNLSEMDAAIGLDYAAKTLAELRVTTEGQEGLRAFLEKRKPSWIKE